MLSKLWKWLFSDLDQRVDSITIERDVVQDICALARGSWPKETIQFLTGDVEKREGKKVLVITGLYVKSYEANRNATFFSLHDLPMTGVYGTVHSHPSGNNNPSGADKQLFNKYGIVHLIIGAPYRKENIAAYNKYGEIIDVSF